MIRAVIFDLDGTLLDTLADLAAAMNGALMEFGLPARPLDEYRLLVGAGARTLAVRAAAPAYAGQPPTELIESLLERFRTLYAAGWMERTRPYAGVEAMLDAFTEAGIEMSVLSNKPHEATRIVVRHFFPNSVFRCVDGQRADWPLKPDPTLALDQCRRMASLPAQTALVGDSGSDMATARNGGLIPLAALWGFRTRQELADNGAEAFYQTPEACAAAILERAGDPARSS